MSLRPTLPWPALFCALSLTASLGAGCYASHVRSEDAGLGADAPAPRDARPDDAHADDASVPVPRCESLSAAPGVLLTHAPPNDFALGGVQATSGTSALVAFTSSNDATEMDVSRWVLPIDLVTGAPRREERVTVFGEPSGLTYSAHSRVVVGPRTTLAFTWSEGQGCLRRRLDAEGSPIGPEVVDHDGPCLSGRVGASGEIVLLRREGFARDGVYFEALDDEGRHAWVTGIGPAALELSTLRSFTWSILPDGAFALLASDELGIRLGTFDARGLLWRTVEGARQGASLRLVPVGARLLAAWLTREGALEAAYFDDARLVATGVSGLPQAGLDLAPRGDELWVATAIGATHADARARITRLDLSLREVAAPTEVGRESFVSALRLLPTAAGALLVQQAQRAGAAGGTNLFATPIACADELARPAGCAAWRAADDPCEPGCGSAGGFVWDGARCAAITCACVGPDCAFAYASLDECARDHAECPPSRCEATGGVWIRPNRRYCSHPTCGDDPLDCDDAPDAVCHCGLGALYDARRGCVPGFCTGREMTDRRRCEASGGTWGPFCNHSHCGQAPDPCVDPACRCADDEVWSEVAGCVPSSECAPITCAP
jgi:hypothetical protein